MPDGVKASLPAAESPGEGQPLPGVLRFLFQQRKKLSVVPDNLVPDGLLPQISLAGDLAFRLLAHRQAAIPGRLCLGQIKLQLQHGGPAAAQTPGSRLLLIISRRTAASFVKHRAGVRPGVPSFLLCLQKIIALPFVARLAFKAPAPDGRQMEAGNRMVGVPEGSGQLPDCLRLLRPLQKGSLPVQGKKPPQEIFCAESPRTPEILAVLGGRRAKLCLKIRKASPVADDSQTLHGLLCLRRQAGKARQKLEADSLFHLPRRLGKLLQIPVWGRAVHGLKLLQGDGSLLQLERQNRLGLVDAQLPAVTGAGGMLQRAQQLHDPLIPGKANRQDRAGSPRFQPRPPACFGMG